MLIQFGCDQLWVRELGFALVFGAGLMLMSGCGRSSQAEEDVATLKLNGYDLDQVGFLKAISTDDVPALELFRSRGFDFEQRDLKKRSGVHMAAESGALKSLRYLVKQGADVELADVKGVTPLMVAARSVRGESADVIRYLLEKGAKARRKDASGKFALIHAMDSRSDEAIHLLAPRSRKLLDVGLLYAASMDHHEVIPVLVRYGASVYARNQGETSLMIAAKKGNGDSVKALLKEGANMYAVSDEGKLARDYAEGDEVVLDILAAFEASGKEDALALEWSEEELEKLVQKAMDRSEPVAGGVGVQVNNAASGGVSNSVSGEGGVIVDSDAGVTRVSVARIKGKKLALALADSMAVESKMMMAAYQEKSLPIKVKADDAGRVEVYDLRGGMEQEEVSPVVRAGSSIGVTGLRVKTIKKKIVNNKLTAGEDKELVTLMIEDEKTGKLRELYAGYESQAAEAVAVLRINKTGEHLVVERNDEFYDLGGVAYRVMDVNNKEVIIENLASGELTLLPLMGVKR